MSDVTTKTPPADGGVPDELSFIGVHDVELVEGVTITFNYGMDFAKENDQYASALIASRLITEARLKERKKADMEYLAIFGYADKELSELVDEQHRALVADAYNDAGFINLLNGNFTVRFEGERPVVHFDKPEIEQLLGDEAVLEVGWSDQTEANRKRYANMQIKQGAINPLNLFEQKLQLLFRLSAKYPIVVVTLAEMAMKIEKLQKETKRREDAAFRSGAKNK